MTEGMGRFTAPGRSETETDEGEGAVDFVFVRVGAVVVEDATRFLATAVFLRTSVTSVPSVVSFLFFCAWWPAARLTGVELDLFVFFSGQVSRSHPPARPP